MKDVILILIQGNQRSIYIESKIFELQKKGFSIVLGSIGVSGAIQEYVESRGIQTYCFSKSRHPLYSFYFSNFFFWKRVVKKHKVNIILSHLQWANFIALLLEKFAFGKIKVIPTRHHVDASYLKDSRNGKLEDIIVNFLTRRQVVVSERARQFMLENEKFARAAYIKYIPLGYDFKLYKGLTSGNADNIRLENNSKMILLIVSRHIKTKRHELLLMAMQILITKGLSIKLMILDDGPERKRLEMLSDKLGLANYVRFYGNQKNIIDYFLASDLLVSPSIEESSNQVIKEASICGRTAIVTRHIGDFDEYIVDKENAFFIERDDGPKEIASLIEKIYLGSYNLADMAKRLELSVRSRFGIEYTIDQYLQLLKR